MMVFASNDEIALLADLPFPKGSSSLQ